jgi:hypothetical protein
MKALFAWLLILVFVSLTFSQVTDSSKMDTTTSQDSKQALASKIAICNRICHGGTALVVIGPVLTIGGVICFVSGLSMMNNDTAGTNGGTIVGLLVTGIVGTVVGIVMIPMGAVMLKIGGDKRTEYQNQLNKLSLSVGYNRISLTYKF